jgi:hypothetical protein
VINRPFGSDKIIRAEFPGSFARCLLAANRGAPLCTLVGPVRATLSPVAK